MFVDAFGSVPAARRSLEMREAMFYRPLEREDQAVQCELCPHTCIVPDGERGSCGVRENRGGRLVSLVFGRPVALHVDPIEKKPLFHVLPGTLSYSMATVGCNLRCLHCQNAEISQLPATGGRIAGESVQPGELVRRAKAAGCATIAYTYTEPTVYLEYALETARMATEAGLWNVFVTNGYIRHDPLVAVRPWLHAANVDLKSCRDSFYRQVCGGRLEPVLETVRRLHAWGVWVEVTTLLIPGMNDETSELRDLAQFVRGLGPGVPWHVSAFHPTYRMTDRGRTPIQTLRRAREIGLEEGLRFVYTGNIPGDEGESTFCPGCGKRVIGRLGFRVTEVHLADGSCTACGAEVPLFRRPA